MRTSWDALLFDLDGTLADSVELILHCYRYTMRTHLGEELPDDLWMAGLGTPLDIQLGGFARTDAERIAMQDTYRNFQRTVHDDMVRCYPGVSDALDVFAAAGVPLAVVTSKHREMTMRTLRVCGIADRFDIIITPEDVQRGKPDPEPVLAAIGRLNGVRRTHVLFVGDAPADMIAGRAAGVRTAGALWGPFPRHVLDAIGPDYLLEDVAALMALDPDRTLRRG